MPDDLNPIPSYVKQQTWHELKTDHECFEQSYIGMKPYEIRFNDRGYKSCDYLVLKETVYTGEQMKNGKPLEYTGRVLTRMVTHVLSGYGLKDGWVILGVSNV